MSEVPSPSTAPYKATALRKLAQVLPEEWGQLITLVAENVEIEGAARKVGALQRATAAHLHQLTLLGLVASSALRGDDQWHTRLAEVIDQYHRDVARLRDKAF